MAVPDPVRLHGSCRCLCLLMLELFERQVVGDGIVVVFVVIVHHFVFHLDDEQHIVIIIHRGILSGIEHMATRSHLRGRCRCIEHMTTCSRFVHALDGNDSWGCHEPEDRRPPRQLGGKKTATPVAIARAAVGAHGCHHPSR